MSDDPRMIQCREVFDPVNYTITLYGPDNQVLRHDQYSAKTFPVILMGPFAYEAKIIEVVHERLIAPARPEGPG